MNADRVAPLRKRRFTKEFFAQLFFLLAAYGLVITSICVLDSASGYSYRDSEVRERNLGLIGLAFSTLAGAIAITGLYRLCLNSRAVTVFLVTLLGYVPPLVCATSGTYLLAQGLGLI